MYYVVLWSFIILLVLQRKLCNRDISLKKRLILPILFFLISIIITILSIHELSDHKLTGFDDGIHNSYTITHDNDHNYTVTDDDGKLLSTLHISSQKITPMTIVKIFLICNAPTLVSILFIFTGEQHKRSLLKN